MPTNAFNECTVRVLTTTAVGAAVTGRIRIGTAVGRTLRGAFLVHQRGRHAELGTAAAPRAASH